MTKWGDRISSIIQRIEHKELLLPTSAEAQS